MTKEYFINKILPIIVIVITTITLAIVLFVVLFNYIEDKKISNLEKTGAVGRVERRGGHVFSEDVLKRLIPPSDAVAHVFSEDVLKRLIPPSDAVAHVFSEDVLKRLIPPGY